MHEWGNLIGGRERAKHIDIRKHFAHEVIQNGQVWLVKVATPTSANGVRFAEPETNKSFYQQLPVNFSLPTVIEHSKESLAREKIFNDTTTLRPVSALLEPSSVRLCCTPFDFACVIFGD